MSAIDDEHVLETTPFLRRSRSDAYVRLQSRRIINLSVLKLDGSLFDVHVSKNATVSDLQLAIEQVFSLSTQEDGCEVSWSLVWGHFCLCYGDRKLIEYKALIRKYGISDGDKLHFVRHITVDYKPLKRHLRSLNVEGKPSFMSRGRHAAQKIKRQGRADEHPYQDDHTVEETPSPKSRFANSLARWFSFPVRRRDARKQFEYKFHPSRFARSSTGSSPEMIRL